MNLYLSRLCLNPLHARALRLAADPYELHRRLLDTLPCQNQKPATAAQPKTADLLFRVDTTEQGPVVLLQTRVEPNWTALDLKLKELRSFPETKPLLLRFKHGEKLNFRLLCQPAVRKSGQFGTKANGKRKPGPRRACRTDEERLNWLRRKSAENGFLVETVGLTTLHWANTKPLQAVGGSPRESNQQAAARAFGRGADQNQFGAVRFDGTLVVTDVEKFASAVTHGVGPQKAFGFGLLSIAPV